MTFYLFKKYWYARIISFNIMDLDEDLPVNPINSKSHQRVAGERILSPPEYL
jgi:hypothetical protein